MTHSLLIIGQGLAGTALAWRLLERGVSFVIVDRGESGTCSEVAAGLMTPITGMRLNLSWRYPELHPEAAAFYMGLEQRLGTRFYYPMKAVRLLRDEKMRRLWQDTRRHEPDVARYVSADMPGVDEAVLHNPFGGFEQSEAAYVDTQAYLAASRAEFQRLGRWQQADLTPEALTLHDDGTLDWESRRYHTAIFCQGWQAAQHPWFDWVPFQSARGTILDIETDLGSEDRIIAGPGCWLLPRADGRLRAGPTYEVPFDPRHPSTGDPQRVAQLKSRLESMIVPPLRWGSERTAVRPIIAQAPLLMGRHPARPQVAFLNGLGSKGVLRSPWAARQLAAQLLDGQPLDPEVDLQQNL